eukprot:gene16030-21756_t
MLSTFALNSITSNRIILSIRGGRVPQADDGDEGYFEKFTLDYDCDDKSRIAGSMRGFIKSGKLLNLPENDPFFKWINKYLENGMEDKFGRIKPFYSADFGKKADLKKGENPKIIIVQRKLQSDEKTKILKSSPSNEIDVEVREIWQPWLKSRCDFVVRYVVPNRVNILKIMANSGKLRGELIIDNDEKGNKKAWSKLIFKPSIKDRLKGKRDIVMKRELDSSKLLN